jgi:hypothetical protein
MIENELVLRLTDGDLEHLMLYASVGLAAAEEFNKIDDEEWGTCPAYAKRTKEIVKELDRVIAYDLIMRFLGDL